MKHIFKNVFYAMLINFGLYAHSHKILVVGGGGREHALAWKIAQSPLVDHVFVSPGNAGTCHEHKVSNIPIAATDIHALAEFAQANAIDVTLVGPETPLACGIVDLFTKKGLICFGPTQAAAQIESSKIFAKEFMQRHNIPTAKFAQFSDFDAAQLYIQNHTPPFVIKADGLASGKGVIIAQTHEDAMLALKRIFIDKEFGHAGDKVIIEEFLAGQEISFIVMTDGINIIPLACAQDHKKRYEGDTGPNTGGMGAYSPVPLLTSELQDRIITEIIQPTLKGLAQEGMPFVGFLYAGIMVLPDGTPKVLEFNCRLGDPETEPIMMRLQSDLFSLLLAATKKQLDQVTAQWDPRSALGVVLVSQGYPSSYCGDTVIEHLPQDTDDIKIFHAATREHNHKLMSTGGRVLCVTGLGNTIEETQKKIYDFIKKISFPNMGYRTDIGYRAIQATSAIDD